MRIGNIDTGDTAQNVKNAMSVALLKQANDLNKEMALTLIESLPTPQPIIVRNKIDVRI